MDPWWTEQQAGIIGGLMGGGVGVFIGGIVGGVGGPLASLGKARRLVMGAVYASIVLGVAIAGAGLTALILGQPFHVWFWPFQSGALAAIIVGVLAPVYRRAYSRHEQRTLAAEELRRA